MTPTQIEKLKELATEADKPMEAYTSSGRERIREAALKFHAALKPSVFLAALSAKDTEIESLKRDYKTMWDRAKDRGERLEAAEAALQEAREALILIEPVVNAMPREALGTVEQHNGGWYVRDEWLSRVRALLTKQGK